MEHDGCAPLGILGEDRLQRVLCSLNESARLVTVGEVRGGLVTWSFRLAKAKVAGSNPVFPPYAPGTLEDFGPSPFYGKGDVHASYLADVPVESDRVVVPGTPDPLA